MNKDDLLKNIAETGYNVGFGAKKHFATLDIVDKTPGFISFISMSFGIYALAFDNLSTKFLSASFAILGIIGLYISIYNSQKNNYENSGIELTKLFNSLRSLYYNVKSCSDNNINAYEKELTEIESKYYPLCQSKQIMFSDWYTHYKFFWQHQIDWINEQKNFSFFRDKVSLSFSLFIIVVFGISVLFFYQTDILDKICKVTGV